MLARGGNAGGRVRMENLFTWLVVGLLVEIGLILFFIFRLSRGVWPIHALTAALGFFAMMMALMVGATTLGGSKPLQVAAEDRTGLFLALVILGAIAIGLSRVKKRGYAANAAGERARARDALKPEKRKRPLILDLLGCAVIGAVLIVLRGIVIVAGIALFGRN